MKKLFKSFIPVLTLFSLFFSSCDKEQPGDGKATMSIKYNYTATRPNQGSGSGSGNIANGIVHAVYILDPYLHGSGVCANGIWSYTVTQAPKAATFIATQDSKTGAVTFVPGSSPATYTITITYTCPDGTPYSGTITITT